MKTSFLSKRRAVTLLELVLATAILGITFFLTKLGGDILNNLARQRNLVDAARQAELLQYMIRVDMDGALGITQLTFDTLQMQVFNFSKGYDVAVNTTLFDPGSLGTLTYKYQTTQGKTFIERTIEYPGMGIHKKEFMTNILAVPSVAEPLFIKGHSEETDLPYKSAEVYLRLSLPFKEKIKLYHGEFSIRSLV